MLINIYRFIDSISPIPLNILIMNGILIILLSLDIYFFVYAIKGILNKRITVIVRDMSKEEFEGKEAIRISIYYIIMAIVIMIFVLNIIVFHFSFSFYPIHIYQGKDIIF
ncbi:hypothetical protein COV53_02550 [Candidatus Gottesmanbacteria bacterium CG11_big_fil_rev_8_21_14_0_20_37_11]|uniref:Uncharacterized protein n=1 Tax=Candidatus Gottesmanbacteria bacterium CG11_big_fil_rev_8_21_14_0_20_37_11 TaxID=1974575 RepID=A0A2H0NI24_9BACT|nr:MAG: hypothetical protein COV53_02550 [Candidatus Gottesmanbacteria bacterium CG11_big_fil_rev_8_21_14_0_20_37_11]